jgi:phosphoribosylformylglycinamidine synthase
MGARPIALGNYLCFGEPKAERMAQLVDGVVRGISGYGNCVGVPNITGQTEFHTSYDKNILVNAFALGYFGPNDRVVTSAARGPGNWVVYVGAKTGRDGVHGASMASESFDKDSEAKRPTVQIGDPFYEKLLIESCLEVIQSGLIEAIQDMGAAGLTSSSFEMAAKGGVGLHLELDRVPLRDPTMGPEEILLSESQERMLLICKPERFAEIAGVFEKWGLEVCRIGVVESGGRIRLTWRGELLTDIDPRLVVDQAPVYERPYSPWDHPHLKRGAPEVAEPPADLSAWASDVRWTSRRWIYEQYDQRVQVRTVRDCSDPIGVLRLPSGRGLGIVLGCDPHLMRVDAAVGGADSVYRPALTLAAFGFRPLAATDCLNFGNPEKPQVMSEFVAAVESMNSVCRALDVPIISGNVSFYNETMGKNITPTPATGLVGLRDSIENLPASRFAQLGSKVLLLSAPWATTGGLMSEEQGFWWENRNAPVNELLNALLMIHERVRAVRIVGKMGVAGALARLSTISVGVRAERPPRGWLRETLYSVVLEVAADEVSGLRSCLPAGLELVEFGETIGEHIQLAEARWSLREFHASYEAGWSKAFAELA